MPKEIVTLPTEPEGIAMTPTPKAVPFTSILDTVISAKDITLEGYKLKALLLGKSGSGKTTSAGFTLPKPVLVIDYDGRAESLIGVEGIDLLRMSADPSKPDRWQRGVERLTDELWSQARDKTLKYASILEAGLTSMNRMAMYWALLLDPKRGLGGSPAMQHYAPQMKTLQDHILRMLSLPVHYVLEAHYLLLEDEETGGTAFVPMLYGKTTKTELPGMFNECYHCFHIADKNGKERYYWHTAGTGRYDFMKSSLNQQGKFWTDPVEIDLNQSNTGFQKLLRLRFENKEGKA